MQTSSSSMYHVGAPFDLFVLPDSMSVVSLCEHLAVFDLLTFMARDIAIESLDEESSKGLCRDGLDNEGDDTVTNRSLFIQLLSKCLSVVVQCFGSSDDSIGDNIGLRVAPIINDVAQRK